MRSWAPLMRSTGIGCGTPTHSPTTNHTFETDDFPWACAYREYLSDDARLVLAVLRDAAAKGAVVANHLPVTDLLRSGSDGTDDPVAGVTARCALSGREVRITGDVVVNAAGPWVEQLAAKEQPGLANRLHLSKGVHIVVPRTRLDIRNLLVFTTADKRSIFAIPKGDVVIVGTTDTSYHGSQTLWPEIELDDVTYLLQPLTRMLDIKPLTPDDVVAAWAGVRPLIAQPGKSAKEMSRKDEVWIGAGGMVTVAGGKLTGFRAMAITVMESVAARMGRSLPPPPEPEPIPGGHFNITGRVDLDTEALRLDQETGCGIDDAHRLIRLYGSEAADVLALGPDSLVGDGVVRRGEIEWAVEKEAAMTLEDVIYRRTRAAWYRPQERAALVAPVADIMATKLGWAAEHTTAEIKKVNDRFRYELAFKSPDGENG